MRIEIEHYRSQAGTDPFQRWLDGLADLRCRVAVLRRIDRMADGNGLFTRSGDDENQSDQEAGLAEPRRRDRREL